MSATADAAPSDSARWPASTPTALPANVVTCSCSRVLCSWSWFTARATSDRYAAVPCCAPAL
eukprot:13478047-Alexandrium_andersonii.AAC.1